MKFKANYAKVATKGRLWIPRQSKRNNGHGPNATEAKFEREVIQPEFHDCEITYQPHPLVITQTTKKHYTADFMVDMAGTKIYFEVKGSYHLPTHDRARLAWEIAAEQNPADVFVWAELTRKGWEIETWMYGGNRIKVQHPGDALPSETTADWRRHKKRGQKK